MRAQTPRQRHPRLCFCVRERKKLRENGLADYLVEKVKDAVGVCDYILIFKYKSLLLLSLSHFSFVCIFAVVNSLCVHILITEEEALLRKLIHYTRGSVYYIIFKAFSATDLKLKEKLQIFCFVS